MARFGFGMMMLPVFAVVAAGAETMHVRRAQPIRWHVQPTGKVESLVQSNFPGTFAPVVHQIISNLDTSDLESDGSYGLLTSTEGKELKVPMMFYENTQWVMRMNPGWKVKTYDWEGMFAWVKRHEKDLNKLVDEWPLEQKDKLKWLPDENASIVTVFLSLNAFYGGIVANLFSYLVVAVEGGVYMDCKGGLADGSFEQMISQYSDFGDILLVSHTASKLAYETPATKKDVKFAEWKDKYGILGLGDAWPEKGRKEQNDIAQYFFAASPGHPLLAIIVQRVVKNLLEYRLREYYVYGVTYEEVPSTGEVWQHDNTKIAKARYEKLCEKLNGPERCNVTEAPTCNDLNISQVERVPRAGRDAVFNLTSPALFASGIYFGIAELVAKKPDKRINLVVAPGVSDEMLDMRRCRIDGVSCTGKTEFNVHYYSPLIRKLDLAPNHRRLTREYLSRDDKLKKMVDLRDVTKYPTYQNVSYWTIRYMIYQTKYDNTKAPVVFWDLEVASKVRNGTNVSDLEPDEIVPSSTVVSSSMR